MTAETNKANAARLAALRRHAEQGHVAGGIVYGYRNPEVCHGEARSYVLREIEPIQAEVVRRIFREIARGEGFTRAAKRLNAEGVPAPRPGRRGWATSGVGEIVLRDLYRGRLVYRETRWKDRDGTKRKVDTPASEWDYPRGTGAPYRLRDAVDGRAYPARRDAEAVRAHDGR